MEQLKGCEETCPLQAPGRWNNMHRHKTTFNNPLLALQSAPSPRSGRLLPEEATPLSHPNLELFSPRRTTIEAITVFSLALSLNLLLCSRVNSGTKTHSAEQAATKFVLNSILLTLLLSSNVKEWHKNKLTRKSKPNTTTPSRSVTRSSRKQDFLPPPHPVLCS